MATATMTTCLLFRDGQAREAAEFYAGLFPDSHVAGTAAAPADFPGGSRGTELTVEFTVCGRSFLGLNGGPDVIPNESVSFQVFTDSQEETDRYWNAIVDGGGTASRCGWCKDRWGYSWQIVPRAMIAAFKDPDRAASARAFQAMMTMGKIEIAAIEAARAGRPADA